MAAEIRPPVYFHHMIKPKIRHGNNEYQWPKIILDRQVPSML